MQQQQASGFRGFVQKPLGRILLLAIAVLVVFAAYTYVQPLLAIPAMLLFGLAVPIWLGLKRPRFLAVAGIAIILVVAPVSTLVLTQDVRLPIAAASSLPSLPGTTGPLLENASVSPYTGDGSTNFTWVVTLNPGGIPAHNSSPVWLYLYISTCPGATSTTPPTWCSAGYPFVQLNGSQYLPPVLNRSVTVTFHYQIGSNGIWDWQMGVYTLNNTTHQPFYQTLVGDSLYNGLEGPVVGDYWTTYSEVLPTIFVNDLIYLGAPFYLILLLYMLFKNRERRRKEAAARAAGPLPPTGSPAAEGTALPPSLRKGPPPGSEPPPAVKERTCPNCSAVVYENEATCWKCGARLDGSSTPLPSS